MVRAPVRLVLLFVLAFGTLAPSGVRAEVGGVEGVRRRLNVSLPVGAFAATAVQPNAPIFGTALAVDWDFAHEGSLYSLGGHVAQSGVFTEATPLRLRVGPRLGRVRPYLGLGASILLPLVRERADSATTLRLGAEASAGADLALGPRLYLASEARLQSFSVDREAGIFSSERQEVLSAYLGLGVRL